MKNILYRLSIAGIFFCSSYQTLTAKISDVPQKKVETMFGDNPKMTLGEVTEAIQNNSIEYNEALAPLFKIIKETLEFNEQETLKLNAVIEQIDIDDMLASDNLSDPLALASNIEKLNRIEKKIKESQQRRNENLSTVDDKIKSYAANYGSKADTIIAGYNSGRKVGVDLSNEYYHVLIELSQETRNLLKYLMTVQGKYFIEDDTLIFDDDDHADKVNGYLANILKLSEKEAAIIQKTEELHQSPI